MTGILFTTYQKHLTTITCLEFSCGASPILRRSGELLLRLIDFVQKCSKIPTSVSACSCAVLSHSVMSASLQLHGLQPTRLLCPWDSPGKNTGVGCHAFLQGIFWIQVSNSHFPHWQAGSLSLAPPGKPWLVITSPLILTSLFI